MQVHEEMERHAYDEKDKVRDCGPPKSEPMKVVRNAKERTWKECEHHEVVGHVTYVEKCKDGVKPSSQAQPTRTF